MEGVHLTQVPSKGGSLEESLLAGAVLGVVIHPEKVNKNLGYYRLCVVGLKIKISDSFLI